MASIPLSTLTPNARTADPAGTASGSTNIVAAGAAPEEIILRAVVANATTNVTVKAGANPPALSAGQGDVVAACVVGTNFIGPLSSARFIQADGTINVDVATAANVTLTAFVVPRTA